MRFVTTVRYDYVRCTNLQIVLFARFFSPLSTLANLKTEHETVIFAATNEKSFTDFEGVEFRYKDDKLGILFETEQILEDSLFLLRFNCPDPSCDIACRNWSALKAHVKASHHRYLWYPDPDSPTHPPAKFLTTVLSVLNTKRSSPTNISSTHPANSPLTSQPAIPSKTSL